MKNLLRKSLLGAVAGATLLLSAEAQAEQQQKPENKPVPPVPSDVLEQGADAVLEWMLENDCVSIEYLRRFIQEKTGAAAELDETAEGGENPLLKKLRLGFESLPATVFQVGGKPTWETVAAKLTPDVLVKANKLENPRIYGVNGSGELLIGDGGKNVPSFTVGQNYLEARSAAQGPGFALMTIGEYRSFNGRLMEVATSTWLESGDAPVLAWAGDLHAGSVEVHEVTSKVSGGNLGARRVLRVKL